MAGPEKQPEIVKIVGRVIIPQGPGYYGLESKWNGFKKPGRQTRITKTYHFGNGATVTTAADLIIQRTPPTEKS